MSFFAIYPAIAGSGGGGGGIASINGDTTSAQNIVAGSGISVVTAAGTTTVTNTRAVFTAGNLTDAGTDGITITGGTSAVNGAGTSIAQHVADTTHNGYLSSTDWNTFNSKQSALTFGNLTDVGTDGITVTGGTGAVVGSGTSIAQHVADATHNGYLSQTDWSTFNNKQSALTIGNFTDAGTDGITVTGGTGSVIGSGTSIAQHVADATHNGYLSQTDWSTFNNKQAAGSYVTALTGDVTAAGPGSVAATLATVNANVGTFGNSTNVAQVTVNAKGLVTAAANVPIVVSATMNGNIQTTTGGGTTTLTNSDNQTQTFTSLTSAQSVKLPTTGISAGDIWVVENTKPQILSIKASDASLIIKSWGARAILQALVNTPVANTDWVVIDHVVLYGRTLQTYTPTLSGGTTASQINVAWNRTCIDNMHIHGFIKFSAGSGTNAFSVSFPAPGGTALTFNSFIQGQGDNLGPCTFNFQGTSPAGTLFGGFVTVTGAGTATDMTFYTGQGTAADATIGGNSGIVPLLENQLNIVNSYLSFDANIPITEWKES